MSDTVLMFNKFLNSLGFLSKLSAFKLFNAAILVVSFYVSKYSSRLFHKGEILALSIEPTTSCNLRCPECPSGLRSFTRDRGMLNIDFCKGIIDQVHRSLVSLNFYFQGEPFLNPDLLEMVGYANQKKIYTLISTNAHYLDKKNCQKIIDSGLDELIISIDGLSQETYSNYRMGGKLDKVLEGSRNIIECKKENKSRSPRIVFQFLVVGPNEHEIDGIKQLSEELGVDELRLKTAQIYDFENGSPLIPKQEKYSRYVRLPDGSYSIKNKLSNQCWKMWHSAVISWDGLVLPCCFDKDAEYRLGDLKKDSFESIWRSMPYEKMRQAVLQHRNKIDICQNCTEGCTVWA